MNKINYQKELEKIIEYHERKKEVPTLLLHACCAPCSSYVLEYLSKYFKIDILFYNPNIETGLEQCREGGNRCFKCYELRLTETAVIAAEKHYDYFTTTLSISPLKNADKLNEIGKHLEEKYGVKYLYSDFKKKNGYKRSIELSREYQLYRQNFCGCKFSKRQNSGDIELKPSE